MRRLRLALNKGEELRFLSHLDYAQAVERILRRAKIKMAYSQGFNPHMKISFSSALSLGITAGVEYLDMEIEEDSSVENIIERFNMAAPKGLEALDGKEIAKDTKKMMAACNYAEYIVEGTVTKEDVNWDEVLKEFNEAEEIEYEKVTPKKRKMINMKRFIRKPLMATPVGNKVKIYMAIGIYSDGTVKPSEVWKFGIEKYGWPVLDDYAIHRKSIMIESEDKIITPLEV